jgi:hypothetical protein
LGADLVYDSADKSGAACVTPVPEKEGPVAKTPINDRLKKLAEKNAAFEKSTGRSHFSPELRARRTEIAMWCDQGKNEDQILAAIGGGVSREELKGFLAANNLTIKQVKLRKR